MFVKGKEASNVLPQVTVSHFSNMKQEIMYAGTEEEHERSNWKTAMVQEIQVRTRVEIKVIFRN